MRESRLAQISLVVRKDSSVAMFARVEFPVTFWSSGDGEGGGGGGGGGYVLTENN